MSSFTGTGVLVRLAVRRDRVLIPLIVAAFAMVAAGSAAATVDLYPDVPSRVLAAGTSNGTPALVGLYGRIYDPTSLGSLATFKLAGFGAAMVGLFGALLVVRHTRADEERGQLELVGATVLGRRAPLTAALLVAGAASVAVGVVTAPALWAAGLPLGGSLAFGCAWTASGLSFAAIAGVTAQLTTGARAASGLAVAGLGTAYALRAVGDITGRGDESSWPTWVSPIGWSQQLRAFAGERWWVVVAPLGFAVVGVAAAFALAARRDLGAGLLATRLGPATGGPGLAGPFGLAWRLQRGTLAAWAVAFTATGVLFGAIAADVGGFLESPSARDFITKLGGLKVLSDAYLAAELQFMGLFAAVFGVQAVLRLHAEETTGRADAVLATAVGRARWVASHLLLATAGLAGLLTLNGLAAGIAHAVHTGDGSQVGRVLAAAVVQVPASAAVTAAALAILGLFPRLAAGGAWATVVALVVLGEFGPLLDLPQWLLDLSPFVHLPRLPGAPFTFAPVVVVALASIALTAAGTVAMRRRDIG